MRFRIKIRELVAMYIDEKKIKKKTLAPSALGYCKVMLIVK